jgi:hypothetical protein
VSDGRYDVYVRATTGLGRRGLSRHFYVDTKRPTVRIRSARRVRGTTRLGLALTESSQVRIWYGRATWRDGSFVDVERRAGTSRVSLPFRADVVRVVAWDAARNKSRADIASVRG